MTMQVVWFKRDLRVQDHQALYHACSAGPVLCCYILEEAYWQLPDTSNRQWLFVRDCLLELALQLENIGGELLVIQGDARSIFATLYRQIGPFTLHSHQETGNLWTYERDKAIADWCRHHQVQWHQYAQQAVQRGKSAKCFSNKKANDRVAWHKQWDVFATSPLVTKPGITSGSLVSVIQALTQQSYGIYSRSQPENRPGIVADHLQTGAMDSSLGHHRALQPLSALPEVLRRDLYDCPHRQIGGRVIGVSLFKSFLADRGARYQATISSPLSAAQGCSRLSPHLAYGTVSIKEVLHQLNLVMANTSNRQWLKSLHSFQSRLVWHCYFIQQLERNPNAELINMHRLYDALERPWHSERFAAWQHGRTGWPLVDACMRFLIAHGWLNFRMRAMLVSVACYTLKLPWQPVAHWLAQLFVDYEPGIHYPQIQMQSGTNGNQVLRIYNPLSQAQELDPDGIFVRRWVTELQHVPTTWIFTPEKMPSQLKLQYGALDYPVPMVDFVSAHRAAKQEISTLRNKTKTKNSEAEAREQFRLFAETE